MPHALAANAADAVNQISRHTLERIYLHSMPSELPVSLAHQFALLLLVAVPVACASWTVTHEEVFREPREFCKDKSLTARKLPLRKFFYLFTCEYCFSHYVSAFALFRQRLPPVLPRTTDAVVGPVLGGLNTLHSGIVNDYVVWIALGIALLAGWAAI